MRIKKFKIKTQKNFSRYNTIIQYLMFLWDIQECRRKSKGKRMCIDMYKIRPNLNVILFLTGALNSLEVRPEQCIMDGPEISWCVEILNVRKISLSTGKAGRLNKISIRLWIHFFQVYDVYTSRGFINDASTKIYILKSTDGNNSFPTNNFKLYYHIQI